VFVLVPVVMDMMGMAIVGMDIAGAIVRIAMTVRPIARRVRMLPGGHADEQHADGQRTSDK